MKIEDTIFKKATLNVDKLIPYGFKKENDKYLFSKKILNDDFRVDVEIYNNGNVSGKIIELAFNEEYNNYRLENNKGEFANKVSEEFEKILKNIRDNCFDEKYFIGEQANRISNLIYEKYEDKPEFAWQKFPGYGIFKNPCNGKWYGIIMNISRNKIDNGDEQVEIINIKLDEDEVEKALTKKGFYQAYHMNKKNWVTIILDNTLSDDEIMNFVNKSHGFTENPDEWIIPANPKYYDVINYFNDNDTILWKQSNNIKIGDIVYVYMACPCSSILYKCLVLEVNIPYEDDSQKPIMKKGMKLKLLEKYDKDKYPFNKLNELGVKAIRGPRRVPERLSKYISANQG